MLVGEWKREVYHVHSVDVSNRCGHPRAGHLVPNPTCTSPSSTECQLNDMLG